MPTETCSTRPHTTALSILKSLSLSLPHIYTYNTMLCSSFAQMSLASSKSSLTGARLTGTCHAGPGWIGGRIAFQADIGNIATSDGGTRNGRENARMCTTVLDPHFLVHCVSVFSRSMRRCPVISVQLGA